MIFDVDDIYEIEEDYKIKLEDKDKEIERLKGIIEGEENLYQKSLDEKAILKIENRRLNNIITELEKYSELELHNDNNDMYAKQIHQIYINKLKELKENTNGKD